MSYTPTSFTKQNHGVGTIVCIDTVLEQLYVLTPIFPKIKIHRLLFTPVQ